MTRSEGPIVDAVRAGCEVLGQGLREDGEAMRRRLALQLERRPDPWRPVLIGIGLGMLLALMILVAAAYVVLGSRP